MNDSVLVFSEDPEILAQLLTAARQAAGTGPVVALVVGGDPRAVADDLAARGADRILAVRTAADAQADAEALCAALHEAVRVAGPATILAGSTRAGAEVAARLAQSLGAPCASDCMHLEPDGGALIVERRVYGGRFVARQAIEGTPRIVTVPPKRFAPAAPGGTRGTVEELAVALPDPRVRRIRSADRARGDVDITKAEVIVAAGRGVRRREDLALIESLARVLGGVTAASRPLTGDVDWLPVDRRVGLSGQTVRPNLYIACGISGQIEHIVGMKAARTVVAINSDAKAPIHAEADYSIVGDLYEVVPALVAACEQAITRKA